MPSRPARRWLGRRHLGRIVSVQARDGCSLGRERGGRSGRLVGCDGNRMNRPPDYPGVLCAVSRHPAHIVHISLVREQLACATSAGTANCQFLANVWRHLFFALFRCPLWPDAASCRSRALRDSHHIHSGRENWGFCSRLIGIRARCSRRRSGCSRWAEGVPGPGAHRPELWRWLQRRRAPCVLEP